MLLPDQEQRITDSWNKKDIFLWFHDVRSLLHCSFPNRQREASTQWKEVQCGQRDVRQAPSPKHHRHTITRQRLILYRQSRNHHQQLINNLPSLLFPKQSLCGEFRQQDWVQSPKIQRYNDSSVLPSPDRIPRFSLHFHRQK